MKKLWVLILVSLIGCSKNQQKIEEPGSAEIPDEPKIVLIEPKIDSLPNLVYRLTHENREHSFELYCTKIKDGTYRADSMMIQKKLIKDKTQIVKFTTDWTFSHFSEMSFTISQDVNFDGFSDISVSNYTGMYTMTLCFWLYDQESKSFVHEPSLDSIANPDFDARTKRIYSSWHVGLSEFGEDVYAWKNGKAVLLESIVENRDFGGADSLYYHSKRLINGTYIEKDSIVRKDY
ncbi:MAG: hypothetical protein EOO50_09025 [Flavobacterium sp.]|uniref:XAC2610-related protein n=1 Tax=Flavobacterium sp. TaxID=239 RepID=UPI00122529EE|nr:hypothetical protein [Flavobacterium sp.]RZJ66656.1 MAG: hypothetical protein EOO50_09025 [Flavobacterium sp.]